MRSKLKNKTWRRGLSATLGALFALALILVPLQIHGGSTVAHAAGEVTCVDINGHSVPNLTPTSCGPDATAVSAAVAPPANTDPAQGKICSDASTCIGVVVYVFTVPIMTAFAYIGANIFSIAVALSLNSNAYALDFLTSSWAVVRDLANMAFIFILVYLAVTIIFSAENSNTMKVLAATIIMALLINFSFFLTRVVIDGGNILAVQFYNAATKDSPTLTSTTGIPTALAGGAATNTKDLTSTIMQSLGVQGLLGQVSFQVASQQGSGFTQFLVNLIMIVLIYISVAAIMAMLAFAFLTVGFKFVMRIVALWFLIIAAPAAFAARSLLLTKGPAGGWWKKWMENLLQFSFYPAIFLFMFMLMNVVMKALGQCAAGVTASGGTCGLIPSTITSMGSISQNASIDTAFPAIGAAIANVGLRLGIVLIMLYYGLKVADMVVTTGTGAASAASNWVGRRVGAMTYGGISRGLRATAGFAGNRLAQSATARGWAGSEATGLKGIASRMAGAGLIGTGRKAANGSWDVRGAWGVRQGLEKAKGRVGDVGAPPDRSYRANVDARTTAEKAFAGQLKPSDEQLHGAFKTALAKLKARDPEAAIKLQDAAAHYADQQQSLKDGSGATSETVKKARAYYNRVKKETNFADDLKSAKASVGADSDKNYAKALMRSVFSGGRTAGIQLADLKNESARIKDILPRTGTEDEQDARLARDSGGALARLRRDKPVNEKFFERMVEKIGARADELEREGKIGHAPLVDASVSKQGRVRDSGRGAAQTAAEPRANSSTQGQAAPSRELPPASTARAIPNLRPRSGGQAPLQPFGAPPLTAMTSTKEAADKEQAAQNQARSEEMRKNRASALQAIAQMPPAMIPPKTTAPFAPAMVPPGTAAPTPPPVPATPLAPKPTPPPSPAFVPPGTVPSAPAFMPPGTPTPTAPDANTGPTRTTTSTNRGARRPTTQGDKTTVSSEQVAEAVAKAEGPAAPAKSTTSATESQTATTPSTQPQAKVLIEKQVITRPDASKDYRDILRTRDERKLRLEQLRATQETGKTLKEILGTLRQQGSVSPQIIRQTNKTNNDSNPPPTPEPPKEEPPQTI